MAREAGFELCGFARAEPIPAESLTAWLEAGFDADMDWMGARVAERLDVRRLLPQAQTVVALASSYLTPAHEAESLVARYARGRDYHATMRDRLRAFRRALAAAWPQMETYGSIDSGPMMEKVWAARAGLGYVGRNGCLITSDGSYVVLAALILDRAVDAYGDGPAVDRCGGCNLCVSSCPTHAIVADQTVDARLCLSYQSIENDSEVPAALRAGFDQTVFGCDVCQEVCPLNDAPLWGTERFAPRPVSSLSAQRLATMTAEEYQALVPGTALARAKYDGLRRNAIYALGARREKAAEPLLKKLLEDASPVVREAAQWALEQL